ncbi:MAG: XdhC family protein [Gammaproteobacteria bacterium]
MSQLALLRQFDAWRAEGRGLTLATVVGTAGSTYTKAGHRMLIANGGECAGLVSGGCLEADLACHAATLAETGNARLVTYDMRGEQDELFGLGIGCDGLMRILLQQLSANDAYEPLATIAEVMRGDVPAWCTVVLEDEGEIRAGTTWVDTRSIDSESPGTINTLRTRLLPLPRLLVLGAGADALPLVQMADQLGWRVTLADAGPTICSGPASVASCATLRTSLGPGITGKPADLRRSDRHEPSSGNRSHLPGCVGGIEHSVCRPFGATGPP